MENSALISLFLSLDLRKQRKRKYLFIYSSLSAQLSSKMEKNLHMWPECSLVLSKTLVTLSGVVSASTMLKHAQFWEEMLLYVSGVTVLSETGRMCRGSRAEEILSLPLLKSSACMQLEIERLEVGLHRSPCWLLYVGTCHRWLHCALLGDIQDVTR